MLWEEAHASALGTAPIARFWIALEQKGPWGARAATQSHLDPELGEALDRMCQNGGGRLILIRRPGRHSDLPDEHPRRVYLAGGLSGRPWLLEADLEDPARLARLAEARLDSLQMDTLGSDGIDAAQDILPELQVSPGPALMICANSKRDVCCSLRGRPVVVESAAQRPGQIWECSHTGGHRFAPTGVLLPHGQTFARLTVSSAVAALDAAVRDEVPCELLGATRDRGRSHLGPPGQAAESTVRQQIQEPSLAALSTTSTPRPGREDCWQCRVNHVDGRHWDVLAVRSPSSDVLPESCGKEPVPRWQWSVVIDSGR